MYQMSDENQMLSAQIMNDFNQYPILKNMISFLIDNTILIEKMINILSLLKNNPLVRNHIKSNIYFKVPNPVNYPMMSPNPMMFRSANQNSDTVQAYGNDIINVNFRKPKKNAVIVQCRLNQKVSELIEKYIAISGDNNKKNRFIYNSKVLHSSVTLDEAGITNNSNVYVIELQIQ